MSIRPFIPLLYRKILKNDTNILKSDTNILKDFFFFSIVLDCSRLFSSSTNVHYRTFLPFRMYYRKDHPPRNIFFYRSRRIAGPGGPAKIILKSDTNILKDDTNILKDDTNILKDDTKILKTYHLVGHAG